jgi:hypothetical protein
MVNAPNVDMLMQEVTTIGACVIPDISSPGHKVKPLIPSP